MGDQWKGIGSSSVVVYTYVFYRGKISNKRIAFCCIAFSYIPTQNWVCVCVFIKLHITAQSGVVILVILCHSR